MKKFIATVPSGGAPIFAQELVADVLTKETWDGIEALLGSLEPTKYTSNIFITEDNMVLSGGEITDVGGGNFDVAAGIAFFKTSKIIARFPAASGLNPTIANIYINLLSPTTEQKTFFDAGVKDYATTYTAELSITAGTEYVTGFASTGFPSFFPTPQYCIDSAVSTIRNSQLGLLGIQRVTMGTWNMNTTPSITVSLPGISSDTFVSAKAWVRENDTTSTRWREINWTDDGSYNGRLEIRGNAADESTTPIDALLFADAAGLFGTDAGYAGTGVDRGWLDITYLYS